MSVSDIQGTLKKFRRFLEIDMQRENLTIKGHAWVMERFLKWLGHRDVTRDILRDYLQLTKKTRPGAYKNTLSGLKVFFRDFRGRPELVASFKFPRQPVKLKKIPPKSKLQTFFKAARNTDIRLAVYFLLWATSGWRRREVMTLQREDVDLNARMMTHRVKATATKGRLPGIFNEEAQQLLKEYLATRKDQSPKLVCMSERTFNTKWHEAAEACGFLIRPQMLRDWFCEEMGNLDVSDRYIDAFCGRVPKSVLAKHYTDYAPEKLKKIYDRAALKVLS